MFLNLLRKYLFRFPTPETKPFSAWQIELTTRCPLRCRMCIREEFKDWHSSDMNFDDFKGLLPYFKDVEKVVLEGWGESLLHKNLIEIIRLVKAENSEVGFVTSGKGLNKEYISELINAGVDFIGFSLSGASSRTHDSIRVNSDFQRLLGDIKTFNEIKSDKKLQNPRLHIVYLMLKDNIYEIPSLIRIRFIRKKVEKNIK
jgi:MoaA/NifB/PqqE/SkfB family radical SAM enzyme